MFQMIYNKILGEHTFFVLATPSGDNFVELLFSTSLYMVFGGLYEYWNFSCGKNKFLIIMVYIITFSVSLYKITSGNAFFPCLMSLYVPVIIRKLNDLYTLPVILI